MNKCQWPPERLLLQVAYNQFEHGCQMRTITKQTKMPFDFKELRKTMHLWTKHRSFDFNSQPLEHKAREQHSRVTLTGCRFWIGLTECHLCLRSTKAHILLACPNFWQQEDKNQAPRETLQDKFWWKLGWGRSGGLILQVHCHVRITAIKFGQKRKKNIGRYCNVGHGILWCHIY